MDRKQALKEIKKQKRDYNDDEEKSVVHRFIVTIGIVLVALVALYLFVGIFITKTITFDKKEETEKKEEVQLDGTLILAGQIFDSEEDDYYVLIYDATDKTIDLEEYVYLYESKDDSIDVYKVDSSRKFNSKYIVEKDSNKNPTGYDDLKIVAPTLIRITSKTVTEYHEGLEEVKNVFMN